MTKDVRKKELKKMEKQKEQCSKYINFVPKLDPLIHSKILRDNIDSKLALSRNQKQLPRLSQSPSLGSEHLRKQ